MSFSATDFLRKICLLFLGAGLAAAPAAFSAPAYRLQQIGHEVGTYDVTICPQGLLVASQTQPYEIIARPPKWDVFLLNSQSKTYWVTEAKSWRGLFGMSMAFFGNRFQNVEFRQEKTSERMKGLPVVVLRQKDLMGIPVQGRLSGRGRYSTMSRNARYCLTAALAMPPPPCAILCILYHLPVQAMVPLQMTCVDENGKERNELLTASCLKTSVPESFFDLPRGFHRVEKQSGVELDSSNASVLDEMMHPLGSKQYNK